MDLPSWLDQRKDHSSSEDSPGEFTGLGYQATISSFAKSRYWKSRRAHGFDVADNKNPPSANCGVLNIRVASLELTKMMKISI